jgi:hypothetical protein
VPLTGGAGLSVGAVESTGARGPVREESGVDRAQINSNVLHLFELV